MAQRRTFNLLLTACSRLRSPQALLRLSRHMSYGQQGSSRRPFTTQYRSLIITSLTLPFFKKGKVIKQLPENKGLEGLHAEV